MEVSQIKNEKEQKGISSVWGLLIFCICLIGYIIWKQWLFMLAGLMAFTLIFVLSD